MSVATRLSKKEIKDLQREKTKAQERRNLLEEAKLCNKLGDLFARSGEYRKAIDEHRAELQLCVSLDLPTDSGIAHRKLGECLCEVGRYEEALQHQMQHLHLAQNVENVEEEQRAYATIGRTWFVWSQEDQTENAQEKLREAEQAFLMSQAKCNELEGVVSERQWLVMRGRLFLNLGLVHDVNSDKRKKRKARRFLECALKLSHENGDFETEYRSQLSLASFYLRSNMVSYAIRCYEAAIRIAKQQRDSKLEAEAHDGMGQAYVGIGNFKAAKTHFIDAFNFGLCSPRDQQLLIINLKRVKKVVRLERSLQSSSRNRDVEEEVTMWEKLGDLCARLRVYRKAISCYEKQLSLSQTLGWQGSKIVPVLVSLARTHADSGQHDEAIHYYKMEIDARVGEPKEQCSSWCWIGRAHADAGHSFDDVIAAYNVALQCAKDADSLNQQYIVTKQMAGLYEKKGNAEKTEELQELLREIERDLNALGEWSQDTDETSEIMETDSSEDEDDNNSETASSDSAAGSDEENPARRSRRSSSVKINKVNEKGETLLHHSCIVRNIEQVRSLLAEGANVRTRDFCGWTPLHEACNHGYSDIALLLLQNGADVNDAGGQHCEGVTPLHDAGINGHLEVVKLLVEFGADLFLRNAQGMTALDWVRDQLDSDDEDSEDDDQPVAANRRAVCDYLEKKMEQMASVGDRRRQRLGTLLGYDDSDNSPSPTASQECVVRAGRTVRRWKYMSMELESEPNSMQVDDQIDEVCDIDDGIQMRGEQDDHVVVGGHRLKNVEPEVSRRKLSLGSSNKKTCYVDVTSSSSSKEVAPVDESGMSRALIAESDESDQESSTMDNWLVDDIGPSAKRRRTNRAASPRSARPRHGRQRQDGPLVHNSRSPIERLSDVRTRTGRSDSDVMPTPSAAVVSPPMRVYVSVLGKRFVIPCPTIEDNGPKIEWVAGEAGSRYYSVTGLRPRLTLKTMEGALFDANDCVANVLGNNEELQGHVESWDLPPLTERYTKACSSASQAVCPLILHIIESDPNPSEMSLQDQLMPSETLIPFFRSLQCQLCLTKLQLSGNQIGNVGFIQLGVSLCTLPNVACLDVSLNNITVEGLEGFVVEITGRNAAEVDAVRSGGRPLNRLCELNLSYNSLGDDSGHALMKLLAHCVSLSSLTIDACRLSSGFKVGNSVTCGQGIVNLSVAHNQLGGAGVQSLLQTVSTDCLKQINFSGCSHLDTRVHFSFSTNISQAFIAKCPLQLEIVALSGCGLTDVDCSILEPFLSSCPLHQLLLSCNNFGSESGPVLARVVSSCQSLRLLNIAGNPAFGNDGLLPLLSVAAQLDMLDVSGCGLTSPLPPDVVHLQPLFQCRSLLSLHSLSLSNNRLIQEDWDAVCKAWKSLWNDQASCCMSNINDRHFSLRAPAVEGRM